MFAVFYQIGEGSAEGLVLEMWEAGENCVDFRREFNTSKILKHSRRGKDW